MKRFLTCTTFIFFLLVGGIFVEVPDVEAARSGGGSSGGSMGGGRDRGGSNSSGGTQHHSITVTGNRSETVRGRVTLTSIDINGKITTHVIDITCNNCVGGHPSSGGGRDSDYSSTYYGGCPCGQTCWSRGNGNGDQEEVCQCAGCPPPPPPPPAPPNPIDPNQCEPCVLENQCGVALGCMKSGSCELVSSLPYVPQNLGAICQGPANALCGERDSGVITCTQNPNGNYCSVYTAPGNEICGPQLEISLPSAVRRGEEAPVTWTAEYADECTLTGTNGDSWSYPPGTGSGSEITSPITFETTYTLMCQGTYSNEAREISENIRILPTIEEN